jgi:hypothetical protein
MAERFLTLVQDGRVVAHITARQRVCSSHTAVARWHGGAYLAARHHELLSSPSKTGKSKHLQPIRNQENKQWFKSLGENIGEQKVKIRSQLMSTQAAFQ